MDKDIYSIQEIEQSYIDDLNTLGDWFLQYEYLLEISADLPKIEPAQRTEESKVKGCQSGVWLLLSEMDGKVSVRADSDALIIRGMLAIIVGIFDGRRKEEIADFKPSFIEKTSLKKQISTDRFNGMNSVMAQIINFANGAAED